MKALVYGFGSFGGPSVFADVWDGTGTLVGTFNLQTPFNYTDSSAADYYADIVSGVISGLAGNGVTVVAGDISYLWQILSPGASAPAESALSLSTTTGTGATGVVVSTTHDAYVFISGSASTTASIAGNAAEDVIIERAPTNSSTAGDWVEMGRIGNSQALSLAITLQSIQATKSQVCVFVPKGYAIKARTVASGTASATLGAVRQVLI